jgi:serine/threonine protein kinase
MHFLHSRQVLHRDLKSLNVLLSACGQVRICDFGFSRPLALDGRMTGNVGTPHWMAPELLDGSGAYDETVDVYSYGVILYQMFTTKTDLDDLRTNRSSEQILLRVAKGARLRRQPEIPDAFWDLITRCWRQAPGERPGFAAIVDEMMNSDEFMVPGTDDKEYRKYRIRMTRQSAGAVPTLTTSIRTPEKAEAKTLSQGELSVSLLASARGGIFQEEAKKSLSRSGLRFQKRTTRYDFTRSKYKRE